MYLGKVIGTCVASRKIDGLERSKLLVVQPLDHEGNDTRPAEVAVDTVRAGVGDHVYLVGSREAAVALDLFVPVDAAIIGIVDAIDATRGRDEPDPFEV